MEARGAGPGGATEALRHAFLAHGAAQCGICTPGMLMAAAALLDRVAAPDEAQVRDALGGVLCRCTGYRKIIAAVVAAVTLAAMMVLTPLMIAAARIVLPWVFFNPADAAVPALAIVLSLGIAIIGARGALALLVGPLHDPRHDQRGGHEQDDQHGERLDEREAARAATKAGGHARGGPAGAWAGDHSNHAKRAAASA